ncbi:MAG: hypothetical protein AAFQ36_07370 [Pseudomonadota bacterium]
MSNPDSFIDEVSEELRRDQFNRMLTRYGWIAALVVLVIVGGAGFNEWRQAQAETQARALGDAIDLAYREPDPAARAAALAAIEGAESAPMVGFLEGSALLAAGEPTQAVARFEALAETHAGDEILRDLALIRMVAAMEQAGGAPADRRDILDPMISADGAFALLALEQRAVSFIEDGDREAALEDLNRIFGAVDVTAALRDRTQTLIVALGGDVPTPARLLDE